MGSNCWQGLSWPLVVVTRTWGLSLWPYLWVLHPSHLFSWKQHHLFGVQEGKDSLWIWVQICPSYPWTTAFYLKNQGSRPFFCLSSGWSVYGLSGREEWALRERETFPRSSKRIQKTSSLILQHVFYHISKKYIYTIILQWQTPYIWMILFKSRQTLS